MYSKVLTQPTAFATLAATKTKRRRKKVHDGGMVDGERERERDRQTK